MSICTSFSDPERQGMNSAEVHVICWLELCNPAMKLVVMSFSGKQGVKSTHKAPSQRFYPCL